MKLLILIAQAKASGVALLTADKSVSLYPSVIFFWQMRATVNVERFSSTHQKNFFCQSQTFRCIF